MNPNTAQTLQTFCKIAATVFTILAALCGLGFYWFGTKAKPVENESIGFELKAERSEIEDNIAMDHQKGFKVEMKDSTFKRNVSKGRDPSIKEHSKEAKNSAPKGVTKQNDKKIKIVGNVIIGSNKGISGAFEDSTIKYNLTDGDVHNKERLPEKIAILDTSAFNFEKVKDIKTIFEQASFYQTTAESYGAYGEWGKAINYAYKSFESYLKIPLGDDNPFVKTEKDKEEAALYLCAKLNFFANTVRKETNKNYTYFLNELLKLAKENNNERGIKILQERIALKSKKTQ